MMMQRYKKAGQLLALCIILVACSAPALHCQQPELTDPAGNKYPTKILADSMLWMTSNLNLNIPGSYCYDNLPYNCERYGRLYLWEAAKNVCAILGAGWRLPSADEWQQLSRAFSPSPHDPDLTRKTAFKTLLYSGNSGFNALLGGGRGPDSQYARIDAHGFYWTATAGDSSLAWFANFAKGSQSLFMQREGEKSRAFSVRCIRKAAP